MRTPRPLVVAIVLAAIVLSACAASTTDEANRRGEALEAALADHGFELAAEEAVWLFGEHGGHLCGDDLENTAFVGHRFSLRKTDVSSRDIEFAAAVVDVYCPETRERFDDYVAGLAISDG